MGINTVSQEAEVLEVDPVPARGLLNPKKDCFEPQRIALYNLAGACVQQVEVNATSSAIDVSSLPAGGIYYFTGYH